MPTPIRIPPHSDEAEESVLGAILIDKDAIVAVAPKLKPEFFYDESRGLIFKAALSLYEKRKPIDLVTLSEEIKRDKALTKIGGKAYLARLTNLVPTAANVEEYAQIIKDNFVKRKLISLAAQISSSAFEEGEATEKILDQAEGEIFSLSQSNLQRSFIPLREVLSESFDRLDELHKRAGGLRGVPTGFKELDNLLAGMQASNMIVLAARPGIGKTALGLNFARHAAVEENLTVGFFSLEMSQEELVDRLLVRQAQIDSWKLKTGRLDEDDFSRLSEAMGTLAEAPLFIDDTPGISVAEMRTKARRLQTEKSLDFIVVDYLQLVHGRNLENRVQEVSEISQGLKNLARELKVPLVAVSQLSRAVEIRGGQRPRLADLRESGCISGDTLIQMANGERIAIEKLALKNKPFLVMSLNEKTWRLEPALAKKAWCSGKKLVFCLKTQLGQEIKASANHRFFTSSGWKRLDQLKAGDHIALVRSWKNLPQTKPTMTAAELALLGHLIGDGCTLPKHAVQYTTNEKELAETVVKASKDIFGEKINPRINRERNWWQVYLSAGYPLSRHRRNPLAAWLDKLKIWGCRAKEKRVPEKVFKQPPQEISRFLHHLWLTDGSITLSGKKKERPIIYYATSSDIYWDKIVSIKPLGVEKVYDIEVPGYHNFVAENIVIHNSIEQDADVVMFLYHEDEDDRENVVLEIAKHRNGPLGQINLRFVPKQVSFYPVEKRLGEKE